ncbi:hypothetical protein [Haladaptatus caseinilyticus]|uniref:hypothetical protein n=1 Tax=Haladaptatus caseinilyticus TaxID=2993314 RepID=UPI00224B9377|nr:hypothetical protein [Haladaptatus caseinilyticus]
MYRRVATTESFRVTFNDAGFESVKIESKGESGQFAREWDDNRDVSEYVVSVIIDGRKPTQ